MKIVAFCAQHVALSPARRSLKHIISSLACGPQMVSIGLGALWVTSPEDGPLGVQQMHAALHSVHLPTANEPSDLIMVARPLSCKTFKHQVVGERPYNGIAFTPDKENGQTRQRRPTAASDADGVCNQ